MKLIITIDTEEDNWGDFTATNYSLRNVDQIPRLQGMFDEFGVKPTYLITYPVATNEQTISVLKPIVANGRCEIGAHCHPWNTPPFEEERHARNSMLSNLSDELQFRKIKGLHLAIEEHFDLSPTSFRAGRWAFNGSVAQSLVQLGYEVDTSISPFVSWASDHGPDYSDASPLPFRCDSENIFHAIRDGELLEVPATVGFLQKDFETCRRLLKITRNGLMKKLHVRGILYKLRLLNRVWLSPELSNSHLMIDLTRVMMRKKISLINMSFHSSSLRAGLGPFVRNKDDEISFLERIKDYLTFTKAEGIESITLSEATGVVR
jgi:hypothetical protein